MMQERVGDVALVEAGPDYGPLAGGGWPADLLDVRAVPESHDWGYVETLPRGVVEHRRGRVLGGSSALNEANTVWPLDTDFDGWAKVLGDQSWSAAALRSLRDAVEDAAPATAHRGSGGALSTAQYPDADLTGWGGAFAVAAREAGYPSLDDLSDPSPAGGIAVWHSNARRTMRANASFAFVDPHREDERLRIVSDTLVERISFSGGRATGVRCRTSGGEHVEVRADRVLLTAGAINSPAILLRSGIGPAEELTALGIPVVADVPGVGKWLQDHVGTAIGYELTPAAADAFAAAAAAGRVFHNQTVIRRPNPVTTSGGQMHLLPYQVRIPDGSWIHALVAWVMNPNSHGEIRLADSNPETAPKVRTGYLSDPAGADLATLRAGIELLRDLAGRPAFARHVEGELSPALGRTGTELDDAILATRSPIGTW